MATTIALLGPDSVGDALAAVIARARTSLFLCAYEASPAYLPDLLDAAHRGVRVRILVDNHSGPSTTLAERVRRVSGIEMRAGGAGPLRGVHAKVALTDGAALVMTGNPILRDAPRHGRAHPPPELLAGTREWAAMITGAPHGTASLRIALESAFRVAVPIRASTGIARSVPRVGSPEPQVGPLARSIAPGAVRAVCGPGHLIAALLRERIGTARRRVLALVPYVRRGRSAAPLLDALAGARSAGCEVRLLLGAVPGPGDLDVAELRSRGLDVRVMDPVRCTTGHAKGAVIDDAAVVASANWSAGGLGATLEAAVRIDHLDIAEYFAAAHTRDWDVSGEG